jgi:hypothetical protein
MNVAIEAKVHDSTYLLETILVRVGDTLIKALSARVNQ